MSGRKGTFLGQWQRDFRVSGVPNHLMLLGFVMATYADADGRNIRSGHAALAEHLGKKDSGTVGRGVKALISEGWLRRTSKAVSPGRNGGEALAAVYELAIPELNDPAWDAGPIPNDPAFGPNDPASELNDPASRRRPSNASTPTHSTTASQPVDLSLVPCFECGMHPCLCPPEIEECDLHLGNPKGACPGCLNRVEDRRPPLSAKDQHDREQREQGIDPGTGEPSEHEARGFRGSRSWR